MPDVDAAVTELARDRRLISVRIVGKDHWAVAEDAARLRDGLGVPLPSGVHNAHTEPVADPVGDVVARFARTHGPFHASAVAERFGLGVAVVESTLRRLAAEGRVVEGELRPGATGLDWCDTGVLRTLRRRSLAALRHEAEPVEPGALGRFLPAWQSVGSSLTGPDGVLRVVDQLAGCAVPASALESLVLPARLAGYTPAWLDELTSSGDVIWAGHGPLPGTDGWVSLHSADTASLTLPDVSNPPASPLHTAILDTLGGGGAFFFRQLSDALRGTDLAPNDQTVLAALWDLAWAGIVTNDTLAPLRSLVGNTTPAHRSRSASRPRSRYARSRPRLPSRSGPPGGAGRWSLLPSRETSATKRAHTAAEGLLDRHGVVTRGAVVAERLPGGFAAAYRVLSAFEETGQARRGYFVEGLGAAQFGTPGAVDRLRAFARPDRTISSEPPALVLAATDPANPYGAALPWPERPSTSTGSAESSRGHRPGRKAGALVVLTHGALTLYVERGGKTLLSWTDDPDRLQAAADALVLAVRDGALGALRVERADGEDVTTTPLGAALSAAGFHVTPRGLRLRR